MRWHLNGYGGARRPPEEIKRDGWREQGVLVVSEDDPRLAWPEREMIRQLGTRLYGKRPTASPSTVQGSAPSAMAKEACHG